MIPPPRHLLKKGVSYFANRYLKHFKEDLAEIVAFPFQYIIHTFSENDQLYYCDTLKDFVGLSKEKGLEVYLDPWGVGRVFGGEAFSKFVADHPEECQILSSGKRAAAACPNRRPFQDFMIAWVESACDLGGDVIFWDEPHYYLNGALALKDPEKYQDWACCCDVCQSQFQKEYGLSMKQDLTPEIARFREKSLILFLKKLCQRVHEKGLRNAVCLLPSPLPKFSRILGIEEWRSLACLKEIDILSTDPYWALMNRPVRDFVETISKRLTSLACEFDKESEIWIQGFKISKGREEEVFQAIQAAGFVKPSRIAVWSHDATSCMSELACDDAPLVWKKIREGFCKIDQSHL